MSVHGVRLTRLNRPSLQTSAGSIAFAEGCRVRSRDLQVKHRRAISELSQIPVIVGGAANHLGLVGRTGVRVLNCTAEAAECGNAQGATARSERLRYACELPLVSCAPQGSGTATVGARLWCPSDCAAGAIVEFPAQAASEAAKKSAKSARAGYRNVNMAPPRVASGSRANARFAVHRSWLQ